VFVKGGGICLLVGLWVSGRFFCRKVEGNHRSLEGFFLGGAYDRMRPGGRVGHGVRVGLGTNMIVLLLKWGLG
jgi:hypothetical protein